MDIAADLSVTNAGVFSPNEVLIELSDGRSLTFSLQKLLSLVPDEVTSNHNETTEVLPGD